MVGPSSGCLDDNAEPGDGASMPSSTRQRFGLIAAVTLAWSGCNSEHAAKPEQSPTASTTAASTVKAAATSAEKGQVASAPATASAPVAPPPPAGAELACRTKSGDKTVELWLAWEKNRATGELRTLSPGTAPDVKPVVAESYKGTVLVDEAPSKNITDKVAMGEPRPGDMKLATLRLGGSQKPALPCD